MRTRAFRQNHVREVKCNLCQEWIITHNLIKNTLNTCTECLQKYAEGADIWTQKGEKMKICFVKEQQICSQSFLKNSQAFQEFTQPSRIKPLNWSKLEQMMQNSEVSFKQKQKIDSRIQFFTKQYEQEAQNICQLIRRLSYAKSQTHLSLQPVQISQSKYRSEIIDNRSNYSAIRSNNRNSQTLEEYCLNLDQTRYINGGYEFYFNSEQIQKYSSQIITKTQQRSFGTQLSLNFLNQQNLYLDLGKRLENKSNRSFNNLESNSVRQLRLAQENLKFKINSYLQNKYSSGSLYKILSMNTKEAYDSTNIYSKMIELISFKISSIDLNCFLNLFESENMQTIKLVNVELTNNHLAMILDNIWNKKVERLVLSCNKLTDGCLTLLLSKSLPYLKQIYLGKNRINKFRMKENIVELRSKFVIYI